MIVRGHLARRTGARGLLGTCLALAAILIQGVLPLADATVHRAFGIPDAADVDFVAAAPRDPGAVDTVSKQAPAQLAHACPICVFMTTLGSFTPPTPARAVAPAPAPRFAVWPAAPPARRSTAASSAQPRAPPALT